MTPSSPPSRTCRPGLFVTGTDTGVGKTVVTAAIARCLRAAGVRVGVCKPVATGASLRDGHLVSEDTLRLGEAAGVPDQLERVTPRTFAEPAAPPVAAANEGLSLKLAELTSAVTWWEQGSEVVLVEGVGGLLCPLTEQETIADLASALDYPLLVVARATLGTLNHTLLTLEVAAQRGLSVAGVVLNEVERSGGSLAERTNPQQLVSRIQPPLLTVVRYRDNENVDHLPEIETIDWLALARVRRAKA